MAGGEDGYDPAEALQRGQRHRRALLVLNALDVGRDHALNKIYIITGIQKEDENKQMEKQILRKN